MKRISRRMILLIVLMAVLAIGIGIFLINYFLHADDWIVFSGSPHVYSGGNLSTGTVTDRTGELLLDSTDGRSYSQDPVLRKATMHLLGDRFGYISAPVLGEYADELVGFSPVDGIYSLVDSSNQAVLTISASAQKTALEALQGRKGTIGVYNYKTGEVLVAVSSPTYDPDNMPDVENDVTGAYGGVYLNRFFQTTYAPGSIFKCVTSIAALETLADAQTKTFYCEGSCRIGGDTINCNGVHGTIDLKRALATSCNVAFAKLAVELGPEVLTDYAEKLGVTGSLSFDGVTLAKGNFDLTGAVDSEIAWSGIGQYTDLVNACQYMTVMGAIAGGGQAAQPHLMAEVKNALGRGYEAKTVMLDKTLDSAACDILAEMMRNNVVNMYGQWQFPDLDVCAKSGTAELGPNDTPLATFSGFIRDETYPLAFIVIVEHGGSGSATCAPIAGQVLNACVEALG